MIPLITNDAEDFFIEHHNNIFLVPKAYIPLFTLFTLTIQPLKNPFVRKVSIEGFFWQLTKYSDLSRNF